LPVDLDCKGLAAPQTTLVIHMGGRTARQFASRLMSAGLRGDTPVVAASSIPRDDETRWSGTLRDLAAAGLPPGLGTPVLIAIGLVVSLAPVATAAPQESMAS
jgi:siroheme synthase